MTIKEATEKWVREFFNAIPTNMIERLFEYQPDDWTEVTFPEVGDTVYGCSYMDYGTITKINTDEDGALIFTITIDTTGEVVTAQADEVVIESHDGSSLPMWGTMWQFADPCDMEWLENNIQAVSECGFRVYYSDEFGYFIGIDGAGYSFYDEHWIPLYKARGLQWHDTEA